MDLKSAGLFEINEEITFAKNVIADDPGKFSEEENEIDEDVRREASARILNKRLKVLLSLKV